jgi:hypothetical protein
MTDLLRSWTRTRRLLGVRWSLQLGLLLLASVLLTCLVIAALFALMGRA